MTLGTWCQAALNQQPALGRGPPAGGNRLCVAACSGRGNCNRDTGLCDCPAGALGCPQHCRCHAWLKTCI